MIPDVTDQPAASKTIDELLSYLFDGQSHPLAVPMRTWLAASRRFAAFVNTFRDKTRKKLRTMQERERLLDLQLELETAYLLLRERSLSLVYEPQLREVRGPDFAVSFTTSLTFMLEVTRLRTPARGISSPDTSERIADALCSKLAQLLPQCSNVLLIGIDGPCPKQSDLYAALVHIQKRAEQNDSTLLRRHQFDDRAGFFRQYQRLSEIIVRESRLLQTDPSLVVWANPQAKHPLPARVRTVLYRSHNHKL